METRAKRTDKGYVLNGTKRWITNASLCHVAVVWAKLDDVIRAGDTIMVPERFF